jgi:hypothetical protein
MLTRPSNQRDYCEGFWKVAAANDVEYVVLGDTSLVPRNGSYQHAIKLRALESWLSEVEARSLLPEDTLLVFHDALDVLTCAPLAEIAGCVGRSFCDRGAHPRRDVMLLGERGLWPPSDAYNAGNYPTKAGQDYRYINSGLYAGSWRAVLEFLRAALSPATNAKTCKCVAVPTSRVAQGFASWPKRAEAVLERLFSSHVASLFTIPPALAAATTRSPSTLSTPTTPRGGRGSTWTRSSAASAPRTCRRRSTALRTAGGATPRRAAHRRSFTSTVRVGTGAHRMWGTGVHPHLRGRIGRVFLPL